VAKFIVTQEVTLEQEIEIEAESEVEASDLAALGGGFVMNETQTSWPSTVNVVEVLDEDKVSE
jgi:uncharacterized protein (UPF0303 family)